MMPGIASADAGVLQSSSGGGGGGGGSVLDTQRVVCGASGNKFSGTTKVGFVLSGLGSISSGTSNIYSAAIRGLYAAYNSGEGDFDVTFQVAGVVANSGWTTLTLNSGFTLYRADAGFNASTNSQWTWFGVGNLFGSAGDVVTAVFA